MKRIFCDLCNKEFTYRDKAVRDTHQATHTFAKPRTGNEPALEFTVSLDIRTLVLTREALPRHPHGRGFGDPEYTINRQHADLCGSCRQELLKRLVGESGDLEITSLKWDTAGPDEEPRTDPSIV